MIPLSVLCRKQQAAEDGDIATIDDIVAFAREGELIIWFSVKMFKIAVSKGHYKLLDYLLDKGLDFNFSAFRGVVVDAFAYSHSEDTLINILAVLRRAGLSFNTSR